MHMSFVQSPAVSTKRGPRVVEPKRARLDVRLVLGLGLVGLGIGLLCLGIFHGFAHGSCSTTGYSRNYGPVPRCANGIGWWMLMLFAGLIVAGVGAVFARGVGPLLVPLVFVAIGAPFVALAFGNHGQLLLNSSSSTGKIFSGIFGGCFVVAGLIWGVFAARGVSGVSGGSLAAGLLAAIVGVAGAFLIAGGVSSAIGKTSAPSSVQVAPGVTVISPAAERAREIALCKHLIGAERLLASDRASLTAECNTNWHGAEHRLSAAATRASLAYAAAQCKKAGSTLGLPASAAASAGQTLAHACGNPGKYSHGAGLKSVQSQLCQQIVNAQVPAIARQRALATCSKL
jgi:hypothetical protein